MVILDGILLFVSIFGSGEWRRQLYCDEEGEQSQTCPLSREMMCRLENESVFVGLINVRYAVNRHC